MDQRRWSDLVPDVLREISSRVCLSSAAGFVYFHAVCKPWRNSHDPLGGRMTMTQLPPCLLPAANNGSAELGISCIFSKSCYCPMSLTLPPYSRSWVSTADSTEVRYLTVNRHRPTLHDPFTGELKHLPLFPYEVRQWEEERPGGIIYGDGTIFLYSRRCSVDDTARFRATLLRPRGTEWTVVERILLRSNRSSEFCATYYGGKIMVSLEASLWHIVTPGGDDNAGDVLVVKPSSTLCRWGYYWRHYSFVLESCGELLWVLVQVDTRHRPEYTISFWLHALEEEASTREKKTRWVKKDGRNMADRVLFLGTPNSFAVDASSMGSQHGGCAYFVFYNFGTNEKGGLWRCNLISNKAEFVEHLPGGWQNGTYTWHVPQPPTIAPIQELMKARELKQQELVIRNGVVPSAVPSVTTFTKPRRTNTQIYMVPAMRELILSLQKLRRR